MQIIQLYNNIYTLITNNENILYYLGVEDSSNYLEIAKKVQKRAKPQNLTDNIPLIAFYAPPGGGVDRNNDIVYIAPFVFDIYTHDDVDKAHSVAEELTKMIDKELLPFCGVDSLESRFITAHESNVDKENVYCFTTVFEFSIII